METSRFFPACSLNADDGRDQYSVFAYASYTEPLIIEARIRIILHCQSCASKLSRSFRYLRMQAPIRAATCRSTIRERRAGANLICCDGESRLWSRPSAPWRSRLWM